MKTISPSKLKKAVYGKKVLVDTNIIIYLTDAVPPYQDLSRFLFEMIEKGEVRAVVSIVSIAEVMQGPLKKGFVTNAMKVKDYLINFPNISCQEITGEVLEKIGADNRIKWSNLRTVDSLIVASGLINKVNQIISNGHHFNRAIPGELLTRFNQ